MSACDVVGIGENSVDLVYRVPRLPGAGEKVRVGSCRRLLGGQVATTLATCAALGLRTRYVGAADVVVLVDEVVGRRQQTDLVLRPEVALEAQDADGRVPV